MGFGWLFVGYFMTTFMTFNPSGSLIRVLGYGLIVAALFRLRKYQRSFDIALIGSFIMLALSCTLALTDLSVYLYDALMTQTKILPDSLRTVLGYAEPITTFIFVATLLWSIRQIAKETGVSSIADNSVRNFFFVCAYYVFYVVRLLPFAFIGKVSGELTMITWLLYFAWIILNLILIGSCYAKICDESDVEMKRRTSRFAFVNNFRAELDRREEKALKETIEYREQRRQKRRKRRGK